jgi:hypothetical protein
MVAERTGRAKEGDDRYDDDGEPRGRTAHTLTLGHKPLHCVNTLHDLELRLTTE